MVVIAPGLVPSIPPGNLFVQLTTNDNYSIRWITALDPVFYEVMNRPMSDLALRQLIVAKTLDAINVSLGHQALFPFLVQPYVVVGTSAVAVPTGWIWDVHMAVPNTWENFRLRSIERLLDGGHTSGGDTGTLRLHFSANKITDPGVEIGVFYADYTIDSSLTFQRVHLGVEVINTAGTNIASAESKTVDGYITFQTLNQDDAVISSFYLSLTPSTVPYEIQSSMPGGPTESSDFSIASITHGTGLLVDSATTAVPPIDSDLQAWLTAANYPFDSTASRISSTSAGIVIPAGLFKEFSITAPAGDQQTGGSPGDDFPVWVSRAALSGTGSNHLTFYFSTYSDLELAQGMQDNNPIEFARLDLDLAHSTSGMVVKIQPITNLQRYVGSDAELQSQDFGRGHVVLSSVWDTYTQIESFVNAIALIPELEGVFSAGSTRISAFGVSRIPKFIPTRGQSQALVGSTSTLNTPIHPSSANRYVTEQDQGVGDLVDLEAIAGINPMTGIDRYGLSGALCHRIIRLQIDNNQIPAGATDGTSSFYEENVLPRLTILLGRAPQFGDMWYTGLRTLMYNGDTWQTF